MCMADSSVSVAHLLRNTKLCVYEWSSERTFPWAAAATWLRPPPPLLLLLLLPSQSPPRCFARAQPHSFWQNLVALHSIEKYMTKKQLLVILMYLLFRAALPQHCFLLSVASVFKSYQCEWIVGVVHDYYILCRIDFILLWKKFIAQDFFKKKYLVEKWVLCELLF